MNSRLPFVVSALFATQFPAPAEIVFSQEFEAGLSAIESTGGSFAINDTNTPLNNGTQMMGHPVAYGPLGGGATPLPSYSFYDIELDLRGFEGVTMTFDFTGGIEKDFDGFNLLATAEREFSPPAGLITPAAGSAFQYDADALIQHGASSPELGAIAWSSPADPSVVASAAALFDLSAFDDQKVTVRFQFGTDGLEGGDGAAFDNIEIEGDVLEDTDGDGMHDGYETDHGLNPDIDDRALDLDEDGVSNIDEYNNCTDPNDKDTDDDGLEDSVETGTGEWNSISDTGTDPLNPDSDGDGLEDGVENPDLAYDPDNASTQPGTDPNIENSDGDSASDRAEVDFGSDPTDPNDFPPFPVITILGTGTATLLGGDLTDPENDADDSVVCCGGLDILNLFTSDTADEGWSPGDGAGNEKTYDIFDNKLGPGADKWCCNGAPQDVTVEFEEPMSLTHFTVSSANDVPDRDPRDWQILGSNDGIEFEPIFTQTGDPQLWTARLQVIRIDLPIASAPYKFIRYAVTRTNNANHQLGEIEYFGFVGNLLPFEITEIAHDGAANQSTLTWNSRPNRIYAVDWSEDLVNWEELDDGVESEGELTSFTEFGIPAGTLKRYYRVREGE